MTSRTRSLEIWHIPKRSNIHQTIGVVHILSGNKFNGKSWTGGRKETFNTELKKCGLTKGGKPLSPSGRRTLEALIKYLGFIYMDKSSTPPTLMVTDVGLDLIKNHPLTQKFKTLKEVGKNKQLIKASPVVLHQMVKLQITNPIIKEDCVNILLFPFRITLRLLLELGYLDIEEIASILLQMKTEDQYDYIKQRIQNFRSLSPAQKRAEIDKFKKTEEGILTLVKAPSAKYFMSLCEGTGLCEAKRNKINTLKLFDGAEKKVRNILITFQGIRPFDFQDDADLWIDYYGKPNRLKPPKMVTITFTKPVREEKIIEILKDGRIIGGEAFGEELNFMEIPLFENEEYHLEIYDCATGTKVNIEKFKIDEKQNTVKIDISEAKEKPLTNEEIMNTIEDLIQSGKLDGTYMNKLNIISKITGIDIENSLKYLKGGRLEYLIYKFFHNLEEEGKIDSVVWNGSIKKYGIYHPAPGGKSGKPDLILHIGKLTIVLEVTTIRDTRMQWDKEGASVPDHITTYKAKNRTESTIMGMFLAPSLHAQLVKNLIQHSKTDKLPILCYTLKEFFEFLQKSSKKEIRDEIEKKSEEVMK